MHQTITFIGGPRDGEKKEAEVTGKPLDLSHVLTFPIKDENGNRVSDHVYRHIGDGVFEYRGQTSVRQIERKGFKWYLAQWLKKVI